MVRGFHKIQPNEMYCAAKKKEKEEGSVNAHVYDNLVHSQIKCSTCDQ